MCSDSELNFTCENGETHLPISSCNMMISSDIKGTPEDSTMSFEIKVDNETVVTEDLRVYHNKDQAVFSGTEQCPTPTKPVDLQPMS